MLDEQLDTTGNCVLQTDRRHFSKDLFFWYTIDGYTHTHFVMTGIRGYHDGNGSRLNIHIEHSLSVFYDYGLSRLSRVGGRTWCQPRVWSKPRVTKRCTGREEVGKMMHQPTVTKI